MQSSSEFVSSVITLLNKRRGKILDMPQEDDMITVKAEMPVSESFGIADELRGSTQGRAFWRHSLAVGHMSQSSFRLEPLRRFVNVEGYRRYRRNPKNTSNQNKLGLSSLQLSFFVFFLDKLARIRSRSPSLAERIQAKL